MLKSSTRFSTVRWRRWLRPLAAMVLVAALVLAPVGDAWARSGGRIGGGSFRRPTYSAPRSSGNYRGGGGYYGGYGGGIGFPLMFPAPIFIGGGSIFTFLLILGAGSFVIRTLRTASETGEFSSRSANQTDVTEVQIGLLSSARALQTEMDELALRSDPGDPAGLSKLLQELSLLLVRHEDYWTHGHSSSQVMSLAAAEQRFNQMSLQERGKFSSETLSNVDSSVSQLSKAEQAAIARRQVDALAEGKFADVGEYIVVTLLVASEKSLATLPVVRSAESLRQCLMQLGATPAERVMAVEVLWTPQAASDTLTATELLTEYPQLQSI